MSTPSIALIPSGYKEDKLYSQLPINGDGDLDFARPGTSGVPNATRVNEQGLIENVNADVPRLDYTDGGCPPVLLESSSTNLITESNIFDMTQSIADGTRTQITLNNGIEGIEQVLTSSGRNFKTQTISTVIGRTYTVSFYVDEINFDVADENFFITFISGESNAGIRFKDVVMGRNTYTYTATVTSASVRIGLGTGSTINASSLKAGGLQLEEQSYATSYIPTNGNIETRTKDTASKSGLSNYIGQTEGVLYLDIKALANDGTNRIIAFGNNFNFDDSLLVRYSSVSNRLIVQSRVNGVYEVQLNYDLTDSTQFSKVAFKYKENDFALWVDGVERDSSNSGLIPSEINSIFQVSANEFFGRVKDLRVYDSVLTDQELTDLTS